MKICSKCKIKKKNSEFYRKVDGVFRAECKDCHKKLSESCRKRRRKINSEHTKLMGRKANLKRFHGMTIEEYDALYQQQKGVCAICGRKETSKNQWGVKRLAVDHDHKTGRIRGLLCERCNQGIGKLREDVGILLKAIEYLSKTS